MFVKLWVFIVSIICAKSVLLRSWREGIGKTHNYAQQLGMLCHLAILPCSSFTYHDMHVSDIFVAPFSIYNDEVPFSFLSLQRVHEMNRDEMHYFWLVPTVHNILSLRNELRAIGNMYSRIESLRDTRDKYDALMADHLIAYKTINSTLHALCSEEFTSPQINISPAASFLVQQYLSNTHLLERRTALCRQHTTNTSRYVIHQTHYESESGNDSIYILESRTADPYGPLDETILVRDIVA